MKINIKVILFIILLLVVGFASYKAWKIDSQLDQVACTMDAMMCPDGSYVGRTGPNCEFAACPGAGTSADNLKTEVSEETGLSFQYPETLGTKYMSAVDWPPVIMLVNEKFVCAETQTGADGVSSKRFEVDGTMFCRHSISEGAAGSVYTGFIYSFEYGDQTAAIAFSVRATQCGNYDASERIACEIERETFNPDFIAAMMAKSVKFI